MNAHGSQVSFSRLWRILVALAVLVAPAVGGLAAAHASVADHSMQMMEARHCNSSPSDHHDKADGKSCCIASFIGVAIAGPAPRDEAPLAAVSPESALPALHGPYLGEIATPPPRHS